MESRKDSVRPKKAWTVTEESGNASGAAGGGGGKSSGVRIGRKSFQDDVLTTPFSARRLSVNFLLMSVLFSVNHGAVNVALNYATTVFDGNLGNVSTALIFIGYVLCAMTIATRVAQGLGPKMVLVLGTSMYSAYVSLYFLALQFPDLSYYLVIFGSSFGGFAAGFVWVGEGAYFGRTSEHYVLASGCTVETANAFLGGWFATIYVGLEVVVTGSASLLLQFAGVDIVQLLFIMSIMGFSATVILFYTVIDLPPVTPPEVSTSSIKDDLLQAVRLLFANRKLQLLYPFCVAFGFVDALTITYLNAVAGDPLALGEVNIGYVNTIPPFMAAIAGLPLAYLSDKYGKLPLLIFGGVMLLTVGVICAATTDDQLISWQWAITAVFAIEGLGRGVFEATCRSVFGDFFPNNSEAAFSNLIIASGTASGVSAFLFVRGGILNQLEIGAISASLTLIAMISSIFAFRVHNAEKDLEGGSQSLLKSGDSR